MLHVNVPWDYTIHQIIPIFIADTFTQTNLSLNHNRNMWDILNMTKSSTIYWNTTVTKEIQHRVLKTNCSDHLSIKDENTLQINWKTTSATVISVPFKLYRYTVRYMLQDYKEDRLNVICVGTIELFTHWPPGIPADLC